MSKDLCRANFALTSPVVCENRFTPLVELAVRVLRLTCAKKKLIYCILMYAISWWLTNEFAQNTTGTAAWWIPILTGDFDLFLSLVMYRYQMQLPQVMVKVLKQHWIKIQFFNHVNNGLSGKRQVFQSSRFEVQNSLFIETVVAKRSFYNFKTKKRY